MAAISDEDLAPHVRLRRGAPDLRRETSQPRQRRGRRQGRLMATIDAEPRGGSPDVAHLSAADTARGWVARRSGCRRAISLVLRRIVGGWR
jgi:hypothetical protein